jgi:hypothetical protein
MRYRQIAPPGHLKSHIQYFWSLESDLFDLSFKKFGPWPMVARELSCNEKKPADRPTHPRRALRDRPVQRELIVARSAKSPGIIRKNAGTKIPATGRHFSQAVRPHQPFSGIAAHRTAFEGRWVLLNNVRTAFAALALILTSAASILPPSK